MRQSMHANTVEPRLTITSVRRPSRYNDHIFGTNKVSIIKANLAQTSLTTTISSDPPGGHYSEFPLY